MSPEDHIGRIVNVRDQHRYDIGHTANCSCGWESNELRDSHGQALIDHWKHLMSLLSTEKETA